MYKVSSMQYYETLFSWYQHWNQYEIEGRKIVYYSSGCHPHIIQ